MTGVPPSDGVSALPSMPREGRTSTGMTAYAVALATVCALVIAQGSPGTYLTEALFWIPLIAAASLTELSTVPELDLDSTLSSIVIVAAALLVPPPAVVLFVLFGAVHWRELRGEAPLVMSLFNRSMLALCGGAAAATSTIVHSWTGDSTWALVPAALAAVISYEIVNTLLLACMLVIRRGRAWRVALEQSANPFPRFALNAAVSAMLSLLVVVLIRDVGQWAVVLLAIPLWLSHSAQRSAREAQDRAQDLAARVRDLEMLNRLGRQMLSMRSAAAVGALVSSATGSDGSIAADGITDGDRGALIPGHEPAAVIVRDGRSTSAAVIEAVAALVGLTWTRLEVEAELAETERARTALTARILEEATHERSRIAMAVHDDVLPLFAAAQMHIDNVEMLLDLDKHDDAMRMVDTATQGVSDGIRTLRDTLEALRESTLVPGTLTEGVRRLLADLQVRTGIRTGVEAPDPMPAVPFAIELLAYETVRGCLRNVERHADAASVRVGFAIQDSRLVVLMRDDGRGFDPTTIGRHSHGLALMRQRAELARGILDITARPGAGTTVRLEVPTW